MNSIKNRNNNTPDCLKWLDDYLGEQSILHDIEYINKNNKTIDEIENDKKRYINLE